MSTWHLFQLILLTNLRCKYFSYFTETLYNLPKAMQMSRNLTSGLCNFRILSFLLSSRVSICLCCSDVLGWLKWQWKVSTALRKLRRTQMDGIWVSTETLGNTVGKFQVPSLFVGTGNAFLPLPSSKSCCRVPPVSFFWVINKIP